MQVNSVLHRCRCGRSERRSIPFARANRIPRSCRLSPAALGERGLQVSLSTVVRGAKYYLAPTRRASQVLPDRSPVSDDQTRLHSTLEHSSAQCRPLAVLGESLEAKRLLPANYSLRPHRAPSARPGSPLLRRALGLSAATRPPTRSAGAAVLQVRWGIRPPL